MSGNIAPASSIVTARGILDGSALVERAKSIEHRLQRTIRPGATLGVYVEDAVDFAACILAAVAIQAEAFIVPADTRPARVSELCEIEAAAAVLCDDASAASLSAGTPRECGPGLVLVETSSPRPVRHHDEGCVHFFTSGSEGRPKGVVRTGSSLAREASNVGAHLGIGPECVVLCTAPVSHGYAYTAGLFAPLALGGSTVVARPRFAASLAKLLAIHQPEIVVAVPAQYAAWAALRQPYSGPLPRLWMSSGAPLPTAVRARFEAAWGGVIAEQYGMTECGPVSVDLDGAGTLGRPYPGVTVSIDAHGDRDRSGAKVGRIVVSTSHGPCCYVDRRGDHTTSFAPGGFRSGDTGWLDDHGRLHLEGRHAHQINVRGLKVDPGEVERAFWAVAGMQDVAVVGVDRADGDQWVAAFVACPAEITEDELRSATSNLESFKRPQRVIRLRELPKTASGKTDLAGLRDGYRSGGPA